MTRTPEKAEVPAGVEVVAGDLQRPSTMREALRDVDRLYLFPQPESAEEVMALAVAAGVRRTVVLSSSSVLERGGDNHSGRYHRAVEMAVERAGVGWTHVRPGEFANNLLWKWAHSIRTEGVVRTPYPFVRRTLIHEADVAAVAVAALLDPVHDGRAYELTGPDALTQVEQVQVIAAALGRPVDVEEIDVERGRVELGRFMPPPVVDMVLAYLAESVDRQPRILPTVLEVTGSAGRPFEVWARDHVDDFR